MPLKYSLLAEKDSLKNLYNHFEVYFLFFLRTDVVFFELLQHFLFPLASLFFLLLYLIQWSSLDSYSRKPNILFTITLRFHVLFPILLIIEWIS